MASGEKKTQQPDLKPESGKAADELNATPDPREGMQAEDLTGSKTMRASLPTMPEIPKPPIRRDQEEEVSIIVRTMRELRSQKKVKVIIPSTEVEKDPVTVGVNGYVYQIKRDEPVELPTSVLGVLMDARITSYVQKKREDGEGNELVPIVSLRFPVSRL